MIDRILEKTFISKSGCIEYQGHTDADGYGKLKQYGYPMTYIKRLKKLILNVTE